MHTLEEIRREYERLDRICRIDSSRIALRISNAQRRLGSFSCKQGIPSAPMTITISHRALEDDALFLDTIRHEYAHAVVFLRQPSVRHGHDAVWKAVCREVGCTPRASAKQGSGDNEAGSTAKYRVTCLRCGAETEYWKAGKIVKVLQQMNGPRRRKTAKVVCRKCGGNEFRLEQLR